MTNEKLIESLRCVKSPIAGLAADRLDAAGGVSDALVEILAVLRKEAAGTPLNNRQYVGLGIQAYAALAKFGVRP